MTFLPYRLKNIFAIFADIASKESMNWKHYVVVYHSLPQPTCTSGVSLA